MMGSGLYLLVPAMPADCPAVIGDGHIIGNIISKIVPWHVNSSEGNIGRQD